MGSLSLVEAKLPPGFRFHPRDEELICDYLMKWVAGCANQLPLLMEVDLNKCEPWEIPENACVGGKEYYFYSQRDRKYATGIRTNRATAVGYWKATGKDRPIYRKGTLVGMRKTLVFYNGRAPKGKKTEWVMHEFRLEGPLAPPQPSSVKDWVLCRVFHKSKEAQATQETGINCEYTMTCSSLPALMEPYITFNQSQSEYNNIEQVPCFSIFTSNQTSPSFPNVSHQRHQELHTIPDLGICSSNPSSCDDNKVLQAVLNHLTNIDNNPTLKSSPSLGEGSSDSYLSDMGLPSSMWNHY